jgi:L-histidine Nalpha-methyltransferase
MIRDAPITLAIHNAGVDGTRVMAAEVSSGLAGSPRRLPCRYFYDQRGCELFEAITQLPEYYLTRAETDLLRHHAGEIAALARPAAMVELGAGSCAKSRLLIEAGLRAGNLHSFLPFDISEGAVLGAAHDLVERYPGLSVYGLVGDFTAHLPSVPRLGRQLVLFLGSTIGNLDGADRAKFLAEVRSLLQPEDFFLLGVDLIKDERKLHAAYNDSQGVTAGFNLNLLQVLNRELGADFDLAAFEHVAFYNRELQRVEMHLRARRSQTVGIAATGQRVSISAGESILTETSTKFTRDSVRACLEAAGMELRVWLSDEAEQFGIAIASPRAGPGSATGMASQTAQGLRL